MAKPTATVNSLNRQLEKGYTTQGSVYKEISKGYITKNGVWQRIFVNELEISYTGRYELAGDPGGDWTLALLSSGKLTIHSLPCDSEDVFLGGRGGNANNKFYRDYGSTWLFGSSGAPSGYTKSISDGSIKLQEGTEYNVTISGTANDTETYISSIKAANTTICSNTENDSWRAGGERAQRNGDGSIKAPQKGKDGVLPFDDNKVEYQPGYKYGASGGGCGGRNDNIPQSATGGAPGGVDGAGDGGGKWDNNSKENLTKGTNAEANSCSGGGGNQGKGGSGIILIRNHREVA